MSVVLQGKSLSCKPLWDCWEFLISGPDVPFLACFATTWSRYASAFIVLIALLPVVIYDSLRLSNRIAGPTFRLQGALRELASGESFPSLKFRRRDFWHDLAEDLNTLSLRLERMERTQREHATDTEEIGV